MLQMLTKEGKGYVESSPPIDEIDLQNIHFESNLRENPKVMQKKVYVNLMLHFWSKRKENVFEVY